LEQALHGRVRDQHRFLITKHLLHIDFLDEQIADFNAQIADSIAEQLAVRASSSGTGSDAAGVTYLDERRKDQLLNRMRSRIERLGYKVVLEPIVQVAA